MRLQPPTGHIPLISSRREYLLSKVRGGGRPRATPSRPRTPSPSPTRNAETLKRLGEGAEGSGAGGGGASRGCGDAAVAAAMEAAAAEMEAAEMEEEARPSSTGATKAASSPMSPYTTATTTAIHGDATLHATTWPLHASSPPPEGWDDAQREMRGPTLPHGSPGSSAPASPVTPPSRSRSTSPVATWRRCGADGSSRVRPRPVTVPCPGAAGLTTLTKLPRLRPSSSLPLLRREVKACPDLPTIYTT